MHLVFIETLVHAQFWGVFFAVIKTYFIVGRNKNCTKGPSAASQSASSAPVGPDSVAISVDGETMSGPAADADNAATELLAAEKVGPQASPQCRKYKLCHWSSITRRYYGPHIENVWGVNVTHICPVCPLTSIRLSV